MTVKISDRRKQANDALKKMSSGPKSETPLSETGRVGERILRAFMEMPGCPTTSYGRSKWIVDRIGSVGVVVTPQAVRKWVKGQSRPRPEMVEIIANLTGSTVEFLMRGTLDGVAPRTGRSRLRALAVSLVRTATELSGCMATPPEAPGSDVRIVCRQKTLEAAVFHAHREGDYVTVNLRCEAIAEDVRRLVVVTDVENSAFGLYDLTDCGSDMVELAHSRNALTLQDGTMFSRIDHIGQL